MILDELPRSLPRHSRIRHRQSFRKTWLTSSIHRVRPDSRKACLSVTKTWYVPSPLDWFTTDKPMPRLFSTLSFAFDAGNGAVFGAVCQGSALVIGPDDAALQPQQLVAVAWRKVVVRT